MLKIENQKPNQKITSIPPETDRKVKKGKGLGDKGKGAKQKKKKSITECSDADTTIGEFGSETESDNEGNNFVKHQEIITKKLSGVDKSMSDIKTP